MCSASNSREVHIVLEASLSGPGKRDALRRGIRPADRMVYTVDPGHRLWERAVALDPEIDGSYVSLPINRSWTVTVVNETHATEALTSEPLFGWTVWRYPHAEIEWGELQALDEWLTMDQLIEIEEKNRAAARRALTEMEYELDEILRPSWCAWMSVFIEEGRKRHCEWVDQAALSDPARPGHQQALARFEEALEAFDASTSDASERASQLYRLFFALDREMDFFARGLEAANRAKELAAEAKAWAQEHGSPRLRKASTANLLHSCLGVYREERLGVEHPEWRWLGHDMASDLRSIKNPSELALDALLGAREWDPDAELKWLDTRDGGVAVVMAGFLDGRIYVIAEHPSQPRHQQ